MENNESSYRPPNTSTVYIEDDKNLKYRVAELSVTENQLKDAI